MSPLNFTWEKLKLCGISGVPLQILQILYNNITDNQSSYYRAFCGYTWSPAGLCFVTNSFNIYINDLSQSLGCHAKCVVFGDIKIHCLLYADDLVILAKDMSDLTCARKGLEQWCERWEIQINSKKSAYVHFRPRYQRGSAIDLVVVKMVIPVSSEYKYLGVVLDQFLTYKSALADWTESENLW